MLAVPAELPNAELVGYFSKTHARSGVYLYTLLTHIVHHFINAQADRHLR
jgi:hypothetical protein